MSILWGCALFLFAAATDVAWVRWTMSANRKQPLAAALWAVSIYLFGAIGVVAYVEEHWYVVALGLGSGVGTYLTVRHDARKAEEG